MAGLDDTKKAAAAATGVTVVQYDGREWRVKPPTDWTGDAIEAVTVGQMKTWARDAFDGTPDDVAAFGRLTVGQYTEFFAAYAAAAGQSPGE